MAMTNTTYVKTIATSVIAWQDVANAAQVISSVQSVSSTLAASFNIQLARESATAFTAGWPNVRIEVSGKASGNDKWIPLQSFQPALGASIANTTLNGAVSAAATNCVV